MPHTSDKAEISRRGRKIRIDAANAAMAELCRRHAVAVLDLNPIVSRGGVRRPEMTEDGLHFTRRANALWLKALRPMLA